MSTFLALSRARERINLNSLSSDTAAAVAGTGAALAGIYLIATRGRGTAGKALAPAPDAGQRARESLARTLLNHNDFITIH